MKLHELLADVPVTKVEGLVQREISEVRDDSRSVAPEDLFVAVAGLSVDGHAFVEQAFSRGAAAVVVERAESALPAGRTMVTVPSSAEALAQIAANRYRRPAEQLCLTGITGTNGKTTTAHLIEAILKASAARVGMIGTVAHRFADQVRPASMTTPTALQLQALLGEIRDAGCSHAVMEVSSHALALGRVRGLTFRCAVFTNLTRDHLDFHGSMESYLAAKTLLFREYVSGTSVILVDSRAGLEMANQARGRVLTCSLKGKADIQVDNWTSSLDGIEAHLHTPAGAIEIRSRLVGEYNVENIACAVASGIALDVSPLDISQGVEALSGVPGRLEPISGAGFHVFVDYAHTPDALERAIAALRPLTTGRLLVVFGCGGDRDRTKRPLMGEVVARSADVAVVTSDNPRTEEPQAIVDEILLGVRRAQAKALVVEVDRRAAIRAAIAGARKGDTVLIAGKGHEDYQILGRTKIHFDDREEAKAALRGRS